MLQGEEYKQMLICTVEAEEALQVLKVVAGYQRRFACVVMCYACCPGEIDAG